MAGEIPNLEAIERTGTGKAPPVKRVAMAWCRAWYMAGALIRFPSKSQNVLLKKLKAGRFLSTLFNLKVDGHEDVRVICRDVQRHVVKDLPTHLDLMRLRRTSRVSLYIPVEFINEDSCTGIKRGGVLTIVRPEVELRVTAGDIPEKITVDLSGLPIGEVITISSVNLPEGTRPTIDRDFVIANISAPRGLSDSAMTMMHLKRRRGSRRSNRRIRCFS